MMASAVREERRPGLFVFAAHERFGHLGRLWLEASDTPRAGTVGRHDEVDLALPLDGALSLRHVLFVVQRAGGGVRFTAVDLGTPDGLRLEGGDRVRLAEAEGVQIFVASEFVFFCVPTGKDVPWKSDAPRPFSTLAQRVSLRTEWPEAVLSQRVMGRLELPGGWSVRLRADALRRGVLVGRMPRCEVRVEEESVSRVHAVLMAVGGVPFLFDAGSTVGTWRGARRVFVAPLVDGEVLRLGFEVEVCWRSAQ
jgi:FHA domain